MIKPNKNDYLTTNQIEYQENLNKYFSDLEKYCTYIEEALKSKA